MNAPKKRLTTPSTTIIKLFIEPGSRLPRHKPNPIPQRPTTVNKNENFEFHWNILVSINKPSLEVIKLCLS